MLCLATFCGSWIGITSACTSEVRTKILTTGISKHRVWIRVRVRVRVQVGLRVGLRVRVSSVVPIFRDARSSLLYYHHSRFYFKIDRFKRRFESPVLRLNMLSCTQLNLHALQHSPCQTSETQSRRTGFRKNLHSSFQFTYFIAIYFAGRLMSSYSNLDLHVIPPLQSWLGTRQIGPPWFVNYHRKLGACSYLAKTELFFRIYVYKPTRR